MSTSRHLPQNGHEVSFITQPRAAEIAGVRKLEYEPAVPSGAAHAHTHELENGVMNGLPVARLCEWLARDGSSPCENHSDTASTSDVLLISQP